MNLSNSSVCCSYTLWLTLVFFEVRASHESLAARASLWQTHSINSIDSFFFKSNWKNELNFPIMTDAWSQDKDKIFQKGIWLTVTYFLNWAKIPLALSLVASNAINLCNGMMTSRVLESTKRTRNVILLLLLFVDPSNTQFVANTQWKKSQKPGQNSKNENDSIDVTIIIYQEMELLHSFVKGQRATFYTCFLGAARTCSCQRQCLQIVGLFGPHHVPIWEKHMQTWRVSVSALLHAAVTSFV